MLLVRSISSFPLLTGSHGTHPDATAQSAKSVSAIAQSANFVQNCLCCFAQSSGCLPTVTSIIFCRVLRSVNSCFFGWLMWHLRHETSNGSDCLHFLRLYPKVAALATLWTALFSLAIWTEFVWLDVRLLSHLAFSWPVSVTGFEDASMAHTLTIYFWVSCHDAATAIFFWKLFLWLAVHDFAAVQ